MISSIGSSTIASWASDLFSKLDTKNQGYIEQSDLQSAFSNISGSPGTTDSSSMEEVFSQLDGNSDGKVTEDELATTLQKIADELDSQFNSMRMRAGMGGPGGIGGAPPPPPPGNAGGDDGSGFAKDQLTSQLDEIGSTDTQRSTLISNLIDNFDTADTDGDGKISANEAMAYDEATRSASSDASSGTTGGLSAAENESREEIAMIKIMQLLHAYGAFGHDPSQPASSTTISTSA